MPWLCDPHSRIERIEIRLAAKSEAFLSRLELPAGRCQSTRSIDFSSGLRLFIRVCGN